MQGELVRLASAKELVQLLPFSAVSVVLLTAVWSYESQSAREAIQQARELVNCNSLKVSYYELSVPISHLHLSLPADPPGGPAGLSLRESWRTASAARNVSSQIPWFPSVRIFLGGSRAVIPSTYVDSFTPTDIAQFVELHCRRQNEEVRKILVAKGVEVAHKEEVRSLSAIAALNRFVSPISRDRFGREMKKLPTPPLGILFMVHGGTAAILQTHMDAWNAVAQSISVVNVRKMEEHDITKRWVVSIVDTEVDRQLAERNGVQYSSSPTLLLMDFERDDFQLHNIAANATVAPIIRMLYNFESSSKRKRKSPHQRKGIHNTNKNDYPNIKDRILSFWEKPMRWNKFFPTECELCLSNFLENNFGPICESESWVWLVIYQPWCGFSQRILGSYRKLHDLFRAGSSTSFVVEVTDLQELPQYLDEMVDGFPTVIRMYSDGHERIVDEYLGPHDMEDILNSMSKNSTKLS